MKVKNNIIAHRGMFNNKDIPENSYLAFKKAIENNYDFELDVQITADNKLVVFHDYNLKRMCNVDINLQKTAYGDLINYNLLDTNEKIPLLRDILKLNNDRLLIDIELKNTKRIKQTVYLLMKELANYKNYIIKSFNPRIVRFIRDNYPNVECGLLLTHDYKNTFYNLLLLHCHNLNFGNNSLMHRLSFDNIYHFLLRYGRLQNRKIIYFPLVTIVLFL